MKIKTSKYKNVAFVTILVFILIMLFEIIPGYYTLEKNFFSVLVQKISGSDFEELSLDLNKLKIEQKRLKNLYVKGFSAADNDYSFSSSLERFNVNSQELNISITSIKPLKKIKKGRLNFQKFSLIINSDYENIYNYCRWLETNGSGLDFEELIIARQKDAQLLQTNLTVDALNSRVEQ